MIEINSANFEYSTDRVILKGFYLNINELDRVYLSGDNGSGKTTTLKLIAGFKDFDDGTYRKQENLKLIYVPTNLSNFLFPWYNVIQNISFFESNGSSLETSLSFEYLEMINSFIPTLDKDFLSMKVYNISSGEKAVVALISALATKPDILLLDELLANTSIIVSQKIIDFIKNHQLTVVFTTHNQELGDLLKTRQIKISDYQ